jgi:hypothetical protein
MIEATQKKLKEAQFFLDQLERELTSSTHNLSEAAEFFFSAFLSAARSVTFVLDAEEHSKYGEWSPVWRNSRSEDERRLLSRFTNARNRALKRETPTVAEDRLASSVFASYDNVPIAVRLSWEEEDYQPIGFHVLKCRLTPDDVEEEVVPLCRKYLALLKDLIGDFMEAHR